MSTRGERLELLRGTLDLSAVFSVVNAVLLRPLSFPHPERVLWLTTLDSRIKDQPVGSQDVPHRARQSTKFRNFCGADAL